LYSKMLDIDMARASSGLTFIDHRDRSFVIHI
jgi:hypothetical protein